MLSQELISRINRDLAIELDIDEDNITPNADVRQTLNLDSIRALQIIIVVKRHCDIIIMPRQIPRITTFQSLYDFIEEKMQKA